MTKKTKNKFPTKKVLIGVGIALVICVGAVNAGGLSLKEGIAQVAGEILGEKLYNEIAPTLGLDEPLGAMVSPDNALDWSKHNGVMTYLMGDDDLPYATTNLFQLRNPFGSSASTTADSAYARGEITFAEATDGIGKKATSTIDFLGIVIDTAATSSIRIHCGVAANRWDSPALYDLINVEIATGTTQTIINNVATSTPGASFGSEVPRIQLTPAYSFFVCKILPPDGIGGSVWENGIGFNRDGVADAAAGTISTENPFRGKIKVRILDIP